MFKRLTIAVCALLLATAWATSAQAGDLNFWGRWARNRAATTSWHGNHYHMSWNAPVALVVPPNAEQQTNWGWGVSNARMTPIYHQYEMGYPGDYGGASKRFLPAPRWPNDTTQMGVYYSRGPW